MVIYNYEESIYAALCYIYGFDDDVLSVEERRGIIDRFNLLPPQFEVPSENKKILPTIGRSEKIFTRMWQTA